MTDDTGSQGGVTRYGGGPPLPGAVKVLRRPDQEESREKDAGQDEKQESPDQDLHVSPEQADEASFRLISEGGDWIGTNVVEQGALSGSEQNFTVVSAIGTQAVGKSTTLNWLGSLSGGRGPSCRFATGDDLRQSLNHHTSRTVAMRKSKLTNMILVDTPPTHSGSALEAMLAEKGSFIQADLAIEMFQINLILSLLMCSHVVLLMGDGIQDRRTWRLLRLAETIKPSIHGSPDVRITITYPHSSLLFALTVATDARS